MTSRAPLVTVTGLVKNYQALRPLRIQALTLSRGDVVSVSGLDAGAAEMLIGLLTGAVLADSGDIQLFGASTASVTDSEAWLAMLDRVGIVTDRAVLIGQFTVEQNIAMPFTLDVDPVADEFRARVAALALEVGLIAADLGMLVGNAAPQVQARVRLARALALEPSVLFVEHPSATLPRDMVKPFAADVRRVAKARDLAVLAITADESFASTLGGQHFILEPATGALRAPGIWNKLFGQ
ncbi:MAG TPA: hypothetical protein VNJ02_01820 [Vicinamibacterales bacterium]|nr:hypothetical protein [Vicinamibacterales bacterium]